MKINRTLLFLGSAALVGYFLFTKRGPQPDTQVKFVWLNSAPVMVPYSALPTAPLPGDRFPFYNASWLFDTDPSGYVAIQIQT